MLVSILVLRNQVGDFLWSEMRLVGFLVVRNWVGRITDGWGQDY